MAEVKVKITAQNEVQTGLQASLAEVRQFAGQAQKEMQTAMQMPARQPAQERVAPTFNIDIGDYGLEPLRQMQEELKRVRQSAQEALDPSPAQDFAGGIGGVIGRFAILIGVAATVGKVIASAFDTLSNTVVAATKIQDQFAESLAKAGSQSTLSGAISSFENLQSLAEQTGETIDKNLGKGVGEALGNAVSGRPSQLFARIADAFTGLTGGDTVQKTLEKNQKAQQEQSLQSLRASLALQRSQAEQLAGAGGDPERVDAVKRAQEVRQRRQDLAFALEAAKVSPADSAKLKAELDAVIAAEDAAEAAQKRLDTEKEITREKERQQKLESGTRAGNVIGKQLGPGSFEGIEELNRERESVRRDAEQASKDADRRKKAADRDAQSLAGLKRSAQTPEERRALLQGEQSALLDSISSLAPDDFAGRAQGIAEAQRISKEMQALGGQQGAGVSAASGLQRIGFASDEFVNARPEDKTAESLKRSNDFIKQIVDLLKNPNTLVMKSEF
jgi:hypothetical protein